jgi:hypothetical protein
LVWLIALSSTTGRLVRIVGMIFRAFKAELSVGHSRPLLGFASEEIFMESICDSF